MKAFDEKKGISRRLEYAHFNGYEIIVGNEAIAHYEQMLNFPHFQKSSVSKASKGYLCS